MGLPLVHLNCETSFMERLTNQVGSDVMHTVLIAGCVAFTVPTDSIVLIGWAVGILDTAADRLRGRVVS